MEPVVVCPHCNNPIIIEKINCGIFRHGMLKENNEQINPHLPKKQRDELVKQDLIYGCGKPFQIVIENEVLIVKICDYI
jgi:hypothetical protein